MKNQRITYFTQGCWGISLEKTMWKRDKWRRKQEEIIDFGDKIIRMGDDLKVILEACSQISWDLGWIVLTSEQK